MTQTKQTSSFDLGNSCKGIFEVGQRVQLRGDFGGFFVTIEKIHNNIYCSARGYGKSRHFNMNIFNRSYEI